MLPVGSGLGRAGAQERRTDVQEQQRSTSTVNRAAISCACHISAKQHALPAGSA